MKLLSNIGLGFIFLSLYASCSKTVESASDPTFIDATVDAGEVIFDDASMDSAPGYSSDANVDADEVIFDDASMDSAPGYSSDASSFSCPSNEPTYVTACTSAGKCSYQGHMSCPGYPGESHAFKRVYECQNGILVYNAASSTHYDCSYNYPDSGM